MRVRRPCWRLTATYLGGPVPSRPAPYLGLLVADGHRALFLARSRRRRFGESSDVHDDPTGGGETRLPVAGQALGTGRPERRTWAVDSNRCVGTSSGSAGDDDDRPLPGHERQGGPLRRSLGGGPWSRGRRRSTDRPPPWERQGDPTGGHRSRTAVRRPLTWSLTTCDALCRSSGSGLGGGKSRSWRLDRRSAE